jgi:hypothetical protein
MKIVKQREISMNKKTMITILVCAQLLVTPQTHALEWEMPQHLDAKQIGIIAVVAAAMLSLIGYACYKCKNKPQSVVQPEGGVPAQIKAVQEALRILRQTQDERDAELTKLRKELAKYTASSEQPKAPVEDRDGLGAAPQAPRTTEQSDQALGIDTVHQELAEEQEKLKRRVDGLESDQGDLRGEIAFSSQQVQTLQKNVKENDGLVTGVCRELSHTKGIISSGTITTGKLMGQLNELKKRVLCIQTKLNIRDEDLEDQDKKNTAEKDELQKRAQEVAIAKRREEQEKQAALVQLPVQDDLHRGRKYLQRAQKKRGNPSTVGRSTRRIDHTPTRAELGIAEPSSLAAAPAPTTEATIHQKALAMLGGRPISPSATKPPRNGEDFASLPKLTQEIAQAGSANALPPIIEADDFLGSLKQHQAAAVQAAVSAASPAQLQAFSGELDAVIKPASAKLMPNGKAGKHKRSSSR